MTSPTFKNSGSRKGKLFNIDRTRALVNQLNPRNSLAATVQPPAKPKTSAQPAGANTQKWTPPVAPTLSRSEFRELSPKHRALFLKEDGTISEA